MEFSTPADLLCQGQGPGWKDWDPEALIRMQSRYWPGLQPSQQLEHPLPSSHSQLLLQTLKHSPPSLFLQLLAGFVPLFVSWLSSQHSSWWWRTETGREREPQRVSQDRAPVFCTLILEMPSHPICYLLFIRSKSLSQVHLQGEENTRGREY